jgi:anti-sigma28 factor (negative regulator of flagellin synthesis)
MEAITRQTQNEIEAINSGATLFEKTRKDKEEDRKKHISDSIQDGLYGLDSETNALHLRWQKFENINNCMELQNVFQSIGN